ncbi:DUF4145 domain-containing protein [Paraliobacillus ryukyuensis]|uniref:DUF4145 domain-containing protein n=1 Tax=Paraliobacillus ryukyuensis TaxID=200904 RepID=UPI0009A6F16D|nr:DUF4145 domain-containing protein [Paraliobacillus ryukyuensis]
MGEIRYFETEQEINSVSVQYDTLPDYCPLCRKSLIPDYLLQHFRNDGSQELLCSCPNNDCGSLFFVVYKKGTGMKEEYFIDRLYPARKFNKEFQEEIANLSPEFIKIYNQSHHAEQEQLDLICGVGYRKALEFLIKDFAISRHPDKVEKIEKMPLKQCIDTFIEMHEIKAMAERAVWLGNDETHYVRKWLDKDIKDLKNLIDLTVYFIVMSMKATKYIDEMVR